MVIYIDNDYKCHITSGNGLSAVETDFFDDMCNEYIEGYRYIPGNKSWTRPDGVIFHGEMAFPWKPWSDLDSYQRIYEKEQLQEAKKQNEELLDAMASMVEDVYNQDLAEIEG